MKKTVKILFQIGFTVCLLMGMWHLIEQSTSEENPNSDTQVEKVLQIHKGKFAFCGASGAIPTGRKIKVQGRVFEEGCAICPVLEGPSIANLAMYGEGGTWGDFNVRENPQTPDGTDNTVWSFFWFFDKNDTVPQFNPKTKEWEWMNPINRKFIVDKSADSTSMSNMFAMPGVIFDTTSTGIVLAKCYGPLNESAVPLRKAIHVRDSMVSVTAAKEGFPYPVGTPIPVIDTCQNK
jgi:hypothetical protein